MTAKLPDGISRSQSLTKSATSDEGITMKLFSSKTLLALAFTAAAALPAFAADLPSRKAPAELAPAFVSWSPWQIRVRALAVIPDAKLSFDQNVTFNGKIANSVVPELDISYFFTQNIAAELILGVTPHKITGTGALAGLEIGKTWLLPPTLLLQYHFTNFGAFQPYVGAGVNYTWFFSTKAANVPWGVGGPWIDALSVKSAPGLALQIGFDYMLNANWGLNVDVKKLWLKPDFTADLFTPAGRVPATNTFLSGKARIDPLIIGVGVTYRFGSGAVVAKY